MPFGLAIVNKEDYHHLIRQNNAMTEKIEELQAKVVSLEEENTSQSKKYCAELESQAIRLNAGFNEQYSAYRQNFIAISGANEAALTKTIMDLEAADKQTRQALETLRSQYNEQVEQSRTTIAELHDTLEERDAELQRSVDQATSLGYDNELLRKANEDLATELEVVKRSENEKWVEANTAQAEVIRLKAEIEALKPKVKPAPKRGRK